MHSDGVGLVWFGLVLHFHGGCMDGWMGHICTSTIPKGGKERGRYAKSIPFHDTVFGRGVRRTTV